MNKRQLLSIALFLFILGSSLFYFNLSHYINIYGSNEKSANILIKKGYSAKRIGKELAQHGLIEHPKLFYLLHKLIFRAVPLQAGEYEIPAHATMRNIIDIMHKGMVIIHKFSITEGSTNKETIEKINNEPSLVGEIEQKFNEGDLLADTYYFTYGESKMTLLKRIYYKSQLNIDNAWNNRQSDLPLANKNEAVILASIIEKETGIADERARISGVFINRLRKNIKLQADPTVIYAVTQGQYTLNRSLSLADLKINSPYNSYIYPGLPPTAIASPGKASLEAALNPAKTNDLYFVANGQGGHNFSSSLAEHNQHVNNYRNNQQKDLK
jgi:UPF0755 protein